jgi:hypothetical protein
MPEFAKKTGLSPPRRAPRRYLWTNAFAVCNSRQLQQKSAENLKLMTIFSPFRSKMEACLFIYFNYSLRIIPPAFLAIGAYPESVLVWGVHRGIVLCTLRIQSTAQPSQQSHGKDLPSRNPIHVFLLYHEDPRQAIWESPLDRAGNNHSAYRNS